MTTTTGEPASPWSGPPAAFEPPAAPPTSPPTSPAVAGHSLPIVFHGSGSEYFRIWVVNLLLTLVTIGLYYPWAKVRRLRYFYGNTFIGDHALDFHGDPKLMLRGFLIAAVMAITYSVAGKVSALAGLVAFIVIAVLWPALFWTSQRFRLANTSWRGMRFRFSGDLAGAYRALLPLAVPGLLLLAASVIGHGTDEGLAPERPARASLVLLPIAMLLLPLVFWALKRYQHGHFNLGQIHTELRTGAGSFYGLALKLAGVALTLPFLGGVVLGIFAIQRARHGAGPSATGVIVFLFLCYAVAVLIGQPYIASRAQNLVWGRTVSPELRFESRLRFWPLLRLTFKNLLLIVVTLGFYAPFARIATARMRLQAVSVQSALDPDQLVASVHDRARPDATGDAAGDLFGFDIGW